MHKTNINMKRIFTYATALFAVIGANNVSAQCPGGQANVTIDVTTDGWGYECYWDITATGAGCGVGTLYGPYGNTVEIDCAGGGLQVATSGGYANNTLTTETIGCVVIGTCLDINYVDDYGDGGATFEVYVDGVLNTTYVGANAGGTQNFCVTTPAQYDAAVDAAPFEYTYVPLTQISNIVGDATAYSNGLGDLTNVVVTMTVLQGASVVHTEASTPQNITSGNTAAISFTGFTPSATGTYTVGYQVSMTETEENASDNIWGYIVEVTDTVYARDNGTVSSIQPQVGIGASEDGYLGNAFTFASAEDLTSISAMIDNTDAAWEGQTLTVEVFATDGTGTPTTSVGSTTATVTGIQQWTTATFATPLSLAAGTYVVCVKENAALQQQINLSDAVFTPNTEWVSWVSQPWANIDGFGFTTVFMIRANIFSDASITENTMENVNIMPNPATSVVTVSNVEVNSTIEIHNIAGQVVYTTVANDATVTMPVDQLENGVYIVKVINGGNIGTTKFVKK